MTHNQPFLTRTIVRLCTYLDIAFMHTFLFTCRLPVSLHAWTSIFVKSELDDSCSRFNIVGTLHAIIQVTSIQGVNDENVNMEQKRSEHRYEFRNRSAARIFRRRRYSCRCDQHSKHSVCEHHSKHSVLEHYCRTHGSQASVSTVLLRENVTVSRRQQDVYMPGTRAFRTRRECDAVFSFQYC